MNIIDHLNHDDYVRNIEKEIEKLKADNLQWKICHDQRESQLKIAIEKLGRLKEHSYNTLEKLKCIELVLHNIPEININNFNKCDVYELDCEKVRANELLKIVIEQMESWK